MMWHATKNGRTVTRTKIRKMILSFNATEANMRARDLFPQNDSIRNATSQLSIERNYPLGHYPITAVEIMAEEEEQLSHMLLLVIAFMFGRFEVAMAAACWEGGRIFFCRP